MISRDTHDVHENICQNELNLAVSHIPQSIILFSFKYMQKSSTFYVIIVFVFLNIYIHTASHQTMHLFTPSADY